MKNDSIHQPMEDDEEKKMTEKSKNVKDLVFPFLLEKRQKK
jgi:hypothetical protein